jgi:hypothetical protein
MISMPREGFANAVRALTSTAAVHGKIQERCASVHLLVVGLAIAQVVESRHLVVGESRRAAPGRIGPVLVACSACSIRSASATSKASASPSAASISGANAGRRDHPGAQAGSPWLLLLGARSQRTSAGGHAGANPVAGRMRAR